MNCTSTTSRSTFRLFRPLHRGSLHGARQSAKRVCLPSRTCPWSGSTLTWRTTGTSSTWCTTKTSTATSTGSQAPTTIQCLGTFDFEWSSYSPLDDIEFPIDIIVEGTNRAPEMELRVVPVKMERSRDLRWVKYVHNLQTSSVRVWRYAITVEVHNGLYL